MSKAAEEARALVATTHQGALATLADDGGPLSTLVAFADDGSGRPLFLFSSLSEHTRNLRARPAASLLVTSETSGGGGPMDRARVSLSGTVVFLTGDDARLARERFVAQTPGAEQYAQLPDFTPARLEVASIRFVGGFARAVSLRVEDYGAATSQR